MMWRFEKWPLSLGMWSGCCVKGPCGGRASRGAAEGPQRGFSAYGGLFQSLQMWLCSLAEISTEISRCTVRSCAVGVSVR